MSDHINRFAAFCLIAALGANIPISAQVLSPLYSFDNKTNDLDHSEGFLLSNNVLYGVTAGKVYGGGGRSTTNLSGAMFKLNTDGTGFTNSYIFSPVVQYSRGVYTNTDGANPEGQLVLSGGRLYGATSQGGLYGNGIVFAINIDGSGFTNLYNFGASGTNDGRNPSAGLVLSGNKLYGATKDGGTNGTGTIFAISTDGTGFTNLYNFSASMIYGSIDTNNDGFGPKSGLILSNETLYGTAYYGGTNGNGTVFKVNTDGMGFESLHCFSSLAEAPNGTYTNSDGANPQAGLVLSGNVLYGLASGGGLGSSSVASLGGTVFAVNTDGTDFTNLHSFNGSDGEYPITVLVLSRNTLYGTTMIGGLRGDGTIFTINTDGMGFATLYTFISGTTNPSGVYTNADGWDPVGNMLLSGSTLYGTTEEGGTNGFGMVFALDLTVAPPTIQFSASPTNGIVRLTVQFNCPAVDAGGNPILSWNWNFGDGSNGTSNAQNPTHTYTNAATFLPTLICLNNNGEPVIGSGPAIVASPPPPIQFTAKPTNGLPPLAVQFNSPVADAGSNTLVSWKWDFGDGSNSVSAAQSPSHIYTNSGRFFPSLTCVNNNGDMLAGFGPAIVVINSILLNGGFETGTFTNWTLSGFSKDSRVTTGSSYAHSGKYGAELGAVGTMGFLSQIVPTTPGENYAISFWLDGIYSLTPNDFQVSWDGNALLDETNLGAVGWTNIQFTVTATGTGSTLQFGYLNELYFGLDDVGVSPTQAPAPGIASVSLSGTNLALNVTGGLSGRTYYVLMGTNLLQPIDQWIPVATNAPGADGAFSITATNAVNPNAPQRFYILQLQ